MFVEGALKSASIQDVKKKKRNDLYTCDIHFLSKTAAYCIQIRKLVQTGAKIFQIRGEIIRNFAYDQYTPVILQLEVSTFLIHE